MAVTLSIKDQVSQMLARAAKMAVTGLGRSLLVRLLITARSMAAVAAGRDRAVIGQRLTTARRCKYHMHEVVEAAAAAQVFPAARPALVAVLP